MMYPSSGAWPALGADATGRTARQIAAGSSVSVQVLEATGLCRARDGDPPPNHFGARKEPERGACVDDNTRRGFVFPIK